MTNENDRGRHTPGLWRIQEGLLGEGEFTISDTSGLMIATTGRQKFVSECRANARLIAAAPDMLEVLREIVEHEIDDWDARMETVRAAIAKAEGSTP